MGRKVFGNRGNRKSCGDGKLNNLRESLTTKADQHEACCRAEEEAWSAYETAFASFEDISDEAEGNPHEIARLMEEAAGLSHALENCESNSESDSEATTLNVELQGVYDQCSLLENEIEEAEEAATARKAEAEEATAARELSENALAVAKQEYSEYFIDKLATLGTPGSMLGHFEVRIDPRTGRTHAQMCGEDLPGITVSFSPNGKADKASLRRLENYLLREQLADSMMAAD